ncbi:hypothetical protein BESB_019080 [Besnoitia besnoiti]|uniref:Transmembrane protein n=1 Tax=Besnoitia besnoiti TaxID=94643 RepID=A0A2A9M8K6_BESBE|nr:hypothetical protein BESB_019080 [Besnoitia besnoiti]PFH31967.1 hypothetical protein BESB_019080 [Besnoitia besnoiti]
MEGTAKSRPREAESPVCRAAVASALALLFVVLSMSSSFTCEQCSGTVAIIGAEAHSGGLEKQRISKEKQEGAEAELGGAFDLLDPEIDAGSAGEEISLGHGGPENHEDDAENKSHMDDDQERTASRRARKEKEAALISTMKELLEENSEYRKMEAQREREKLLSRYKAEEGGLDAEGSPIYNKETKKFLKVQKRKGLVEGGAITSGTLAAAGLTGLLLANRKGDFLEGDARQSRSKTNLALTASSIVGALGLALSLLQRRRYKEKLTQLERRLLRMEKEAQAGHMPENEAFFGLDEETPEQKRKRLKKLRASDTRDRR